jgi:Zn-dependent protease
MFSLTIFQKVFAYGIPILFAITVHEVAHGWAANKLGDPTARLLGRLTLNPIKHIDWVGTAIVPLLLFLTIGFIFGWAKPVPIDWRNLRSPKRDAALVASAGPLANLCMALLWGSILKLGLIFYTTSELGIVAGIVIMAKIGIEINIVLLALNLIPIPPLDGSRIVNSLLSPRLSLLYAYVEPFGIFIILLLITTHALDSILYPIINSLSNLVIMLFGLSG